MSTAISSPFSSDLGTGDSNGVAAADSNALSSRTLASSVITGGKRGKKSKKSRKGKSSKKSKKSMGGRRRRKTNNKFKGGATDDQVAALDALIKIQIH